MDSGTPETDLELLTTDEVNAFTDEDLDARPETLSDRGTEQTIEMMNEALAQIANLGMMLTEQTQENTQFIQTLGEGVSSQAVVITDMYQQGEKLKQQFNDMTKQVKEALVQTAAITESLADIQEQQKILIKNRRQLAVPSTNSISGFNWRSALPSVASQGLVAALVTVLLLNQFPPRATAKAEQQWYSIFQRVDQLYKVRFGNKPPKQ